MPPASINKVSPRTSAVMLPSIEKLASNSTVVPTIAKEVLQTKLKKAITLANNPVNDKFFDIK